MAKNLRKLWNESCLNASIPSISLDKAAMTCAVLLEYGNNEAFTLNEKFIDDVDYIQKRYHIFGSETPDAEFAEALKEYVAKFSSSRKRTATTKDRNGLRNILWKCTISRFDKMPLPPYDYEQKSPNPDKKTR